MWVADRGNVMLHGKVRIACWVEGDSLHPDNQLAEHVANALNTVDSAMVMARRAHAEETGVFYVTKTGKVLDDVGIEVLAEQAAEGHEAITPPVEYDPVVDDPYIDSREVVGDHSPFVPGPARLVFQTHPLPPLSVIPPSSPMDETKEGEHGRDLRPHDGADTANDRG